MKKNELIQYCEEHGIDFTELPEGVQLVGAAKTRTPEEILEAVEAGLEIIGEN